MIKINADNQSYVIFFLGSALILAIYCNTAEAIITGLIGALAGMFMGKRLDEHTNQLIEENIEETITKLIKEQITTEQTQGE